MPAVKKPLYLVSVHLKNVYGFRDTSLEVGGTEPRLWTTLIGPNDGGKSTLLRAIAMGFSNEWIANALLAEVHDLIIHRDAQGSEEKNASIVLKMTNGKRVFEITTKIYRDSSRQLVVRKQTEPAENFPWDDLFVCGYGASRSAHGGYQKSSTHNVLSLFSDQQNLLDPEKVLQDLDYRRLKREPNGVANFNAAMQHLNWILPMKRGDSIAVDHTGIWINRTCGRFPLGTLGGGFQTTIRWVMDFLGTALRTKQLLDGKLLRGIVLIDPVDAHLHPSSNLSVRLRQSFPRVQFIATSSIALSTHTDEVVVDVDHDPQIYAAAPQDPGGDLVLADGNVLSEMEACMAGKSPEERERLIKKFDAIISVLRTIETQNE